MHLETVSIRSSTQAYSRDATVVAAQPGARRACVFLDGEYYLERVEAVPLLESLSKAGEIPPMTLIFLNSGGPEARHADYLCNSEFERFVAEDVMEWAREAFPDLAPTAHVICGLSLSGLVSVHLCLARPALFPTALSQSGSLWWEPDTFAARVRGLAPIDGRFWLSVGDEETDVDVSHPPTGLYQGISQIEGVQRAHEVLAAAGADVHLHRFDGGHAFAPWRDELGDALRWLLR